MRTVVAVELLALLAMLLCKRIIRLLAIVGTLLVPPISLAQTPGTFDWTLVGVADENAIPSGTNQTSGGVTATVTWSVTTDGGSFVPVGGNDFVSYESGSANGFTSFGQMGFDNSREDPDDFITVEYSFSENVQDVSFTIADIDQSSWDDFVEVFYDSGSGFINAKTGSFATLGGGNVVEDNESFGDGWEGAGSSSGADTSANISFDFGATPIDAIRIVYFSGNDASGNNPDGQAAGLSDFSWNSIPTAIDLALTKTVSNSNPNIGTNVTYTLALANNGTIPATGVTVSDILPSGVSYVSDNGVGAYISGTGVWTIPGAIAAGGNTSLQIVATVNASGNYSNFAEVTAADQSDVDSTPNNGPSGEDDEDSVMINPGTGGGGTPPSLTCASPDVLDWDAESWTAGALTQSYTVASVPIDFTVSDPGSNLTVYTGTQTPSVQSVQTGGLSPTEASLHLYVDYLDTSSSVTVNVDLGAAGVGVSEVQFTLFDVDAHSDGSSFIDEITIYGRLNGAYVPGTLTSSTSNTASGAVATGTGRSNSTESLGNLTGTFLSDIDEFFIVYGSSSSATGNPTPQIITLHDISFCPPAAASLTATKSSAVYDPGAAGLFAIPGNDVVYTIRAENSGTGAVDADTVFLVDLMPSEVEFYNDDFDDGGAGATVVEFTENSSGLTYTEGNDLGFSNAGTAPANFAACSYSPTAGYDPNVTYICFNPKGAFASGDPDPWFQFRFRARIK